MELIIFFANNIDICSLMLNNLKKNKKIDGRYLNDRFGGTRKKLKHLILFLNKILSRIRK